MTRAALTRIHHVGVVVRQLEQAYGFWRDCLGLPVHKIATVEDQGVRAALLTVGESEIELLEPLAPTSGIGKFLAKRGEGLHHIALRVPDLNVTVERLRAAGARLLGEPRVGAGGHRYVFVHPASAGGVLLELIQHEER